MQTVWSKKDLRVLVSVVNRSLTGMRRAFDRQPGFGLSAILINTQLYALSPHGVLWTTL